MWKQLATSVLITIVLLLIVSGVYPFLVYGIAQVAFKHQADGSLVTNAQGQVVGSSLLAQSFTNAQYFQPRPSAAGNGYDPTASGGTNLGPTSDKLINGIHKPNLAGGKPDPSDFDGVKDLAAEYRVANGLAQNAPVPVDAVTRSASGLDPDISVMNADLQAPRVAKARGLSTDQVMQVVSRYTEGRQLGFLGEPRVNVLEINLALDRTDPVR